jgi:AcrR family transcriptional regulator
MARPRTDIAPRIVHAARERFLREGVDGASLRHIARDAKTSIGMVYYYFPTKDDLFFAVVEELYVALLLDLEVALATDLPVPTRVRRLYERVARLSEEEVLMVRLIAREALTSTARLERLIARFMRGHVPLLLRLVQDGTADGSFGPQHSPLTVALSLVALAGPAQLVRRVIEQRLPFVDAPRSDELAGELVDVLFNGIGARRQGS